MATNKFFVLNSKSSAALISIGLHAFFILGALSFVAVTIIQKEEKVFEANPVTRPKMSLKKLQVPVNIKKRKLHKPKLRKHIVVQPKINSSIPDIKMPEISGVKGGMGAGLTSRIGGAGGIGFTMPEVDVFGIRGKGEKVFLILDSSPEMMFDEMGGITAFTLIKNELVTILDGLPPTSLFNVVVFDGGRTYMLFPNLISANSSNVAKVNQWLKPLNAVRPSMGANEWGGETLGPGGTESTELFLVGKFERQESWYRPAMLAMKQQADAVFLLTSWWGHQRIMKGGKDEDWYKGAAGRRWMESHEKAKILLDKENNKRAAKGQPPRVLRRDSPWVMNDAFFPGIERPPEIEFYHHKPKEFAEGFIQIREQYKQKKVRLKSGVLSEKKSETEMTFNVVHFTKVGATRDARSEENFKKLTRYFKGKYRTIEGLEAIKSSIK